MGQHRGNSMSQLCETYREALTATIMALGGFKRVGCALWPTMDIEDARGRLSHCLSARSREVLSPESLREIRRMARAADVHILAEYEMRDAGYAPPQPVSPEDEHAALQRDFIQQTRALQALVARMERNGLRVAS